MTDGLENPPRLGAGLCRARDPGDNLLELTGTTSELVRCQADGSRKYVIDQPYAAAGDRRCLDGRHQSMAAKRSGR